MDDATRKNKLQEIFDSDSLGLLEVSETQQQTRSSGESKLIEQFCELTLFYEDNQRLPSGDGGNIHEFTLASRLEGILRDPKK